ncbi:MAG TPA: hypothetical protein VM029_22525 [Opitutaceae bacterium]|nr:hypothetical protein [Opitutaceae bacterium]
MNPRNPLIALLAVTTIGGALVAWRQYQELVELRAAAMNTEERADFQKRLWELERTNRDLADRLALGGQGDAGGARTAAAGGSERPTSGRSGRGEPRGPGGPNPVDQINALRDLMSKPEVQALVTAQQKSAMEVRYAALFKNLNLSPEQTEKLKTLLAERQATPLDVMEAARTQGIDQRDNPQAFRKMVQDARNEVDLSIKSLLGESGFAQLQTFDQTMPQRTVVNELQQRLSYTNTPLNAAQGEQLVQILASTAPQRGPGNNPSAGNPPPPGGPGRGPGFEINLRGGDINGMIAAGGMALLGGGDMRNPGPPATITTAAVNQAQGVLSQPQLAALQQLQQQQQAQQQIQQMVRETLANQQPGGPPASGNAPLPGSTKKRG